MCADAVARRRRRGLVWLLLAGLVAGAVTADWPGAGWLRTDVRALLPDAEAAGRVERASRRLAAPFERTTLWLIGGGPAPAAAEAGRALAGRLRASGAFDAVEARVERDRVARLAEALRPHRHGLLAPADAQRLAAEPGPFLERRLALQFSLAGAGGLSPTADPFGLFQRFLESALRGDSAAGTRTVDGVPVVAADDGHYALVTAEVAGGSFGAGGNPPVLDAWRASLDWAAARDLALHATGAPLFSAHAAASAHDEISLIGGVSLAAIALLLLARFRSLRPLGVALVTIAAGVGGGFAAVVLAFGEVHLVALVFGATVIGVSVDYTFHYLSDSLRPDWTPEDGLRHVLPALRLALATSVVAFLSLALAPFPALRQVAVFTAGGLVASWLTVVLLLPLLVRPSPSARAPGSPRLPVRPRLRVLAPIVGALALPGLLLLEPTDDIRLLYAAPDRLEADDAVIGRLLERPDGNRFLLVSAGSPQALLRRQEALRPALERLQRRGRIDGHRSMVALVPSRARQREHEALLQAAVESGRFADGLRRLGFGDAAIAERSRAIRSPGPYLAPDKGVAVAPRRLAALWLGCDSGAAGCAAAIRVSGAGEGAALAAFAAEREGVRWVDRVAAVNAAMREHRRLSLWLLAGALGIVALVLAVLLGPVRGLRAVAVPSLALVASLAVVGYTGALFSVFNLMALLLVLGVGIDYALFYHCARPEARPAAALGIGMAALTTVLAFGLLVFSATPVIRAFGTTLLPGLAVAYVLALVTARPPGAQGEGAHDTGP